MRILYGVTGEGLGHTMRARALAQHLRARGHVVLMAASGRAVEVLRGHGLDTVAIDGFELRYADGALLRARTVRANLRGAFSALAHNVEVGLTEVVRFDPDVVLTDFESFAHLAAKLLGRPVVSFDHQHVLDRFVHPRAVRERLSSGFGATRAVVRAKTPSCAHYIVTSFFFPAVRRSRAMSTTLVGPVVRPEISSARPRRGDHVVVYQTAKGDPRLLPALAAVPRVRFVVYGLGRTERVGNVELREFDEACFVDDLASARAVIANGGFTTLAEAVVLGKPVLSVPVRHQAEQELNAAWLEALDLGTYARQIDADIVQRFLTREWSSSPRDPRLYRGTADACAAVESALARAIAEAA